MKKTRKHPNKKPRYAKRKKTLKKEIIIVGNITSIKMMVMMMLSLGIYENS